MKLAFMASLGYAQMEPEKVCHSLSRLGYKGVEWTLNHFNPRTKSEKELKTIVRITKENGLEISEINYQGFMSVEFESFIYYQQVLHNNPESAAEISIENIEKLLC